MAIERMTASLVRTLRARPSMRLFMKGSTMAMRWAAARSRDGVGARHRGVERSPGSSGLMRRSILPPSRPDATIDVRRVAGEAVVHLEDRAGQSPAVHRAKDDLVVERAEQSKSSMMSGVPRRRRRPGSLSAVVSRSSRS